MLNNIIPSPWALGWAAIDRSSRSKNHKLSGSNEVVSAVSRTPTLETGRSATLLSNDVATSHGACELT